MPKAVVIGLRDLTADNYVMLSSPTWKNKSIPFYDICSALFMKHREMSVVTEWADAHCQVHW